MVRGLDLKKPPSIAESIDWARALMLLGADDIDQAVFERTMSDHRQAPHRPRRGRRARRRASSAMASSDARARLSVARAGPLRRACRRPGPPGMAAAAARVRRRAAQARASRSARPRCSTPSRRSARSAGPTREDFREALAATLAKSQEDRHVLDVLFDRFFFRAVEARGGRARAHRGALRGRRADSTSTTCASASGTRSAPGHDGEMRDLARLAIAAFGRQGEGSGVIGVDVQRIRRTLGLKGERQRRRRAARPGRRAARQPPASSSSTCAASSSGC